MTLVDATVLSLMKSVEDASWLMHILTGLWSIRSTLNIISSIQMSFYLNLHVLRCSDNTKICGMPVH
jgi:hypothetical protein